MSGPRSKRTPADIRALARRVLDIESAAVVALKEKLTEDFERAVELILACQGKLVVTGIGKSGHICAKLAATFASTGTPSFFVHPAEGLHGDLGMLAKGDVVLAVSFSGESDEIKQILPAMRRMGIPIIAMTGNLKSSLARYGDLVLDVSVAEEACPLGLAPTASTTAALALGDALAVAVLEARGFREEDFALFHPGGALGKRLLLTVAELMHTGEAFPAVPETATVKDAIFEITSKKLGMTAVLDAAGLIVGILTDGDLRRALGRGGDVLGMRLAEVMTRSPKTVARDALAARAMKMMEDFKITSLLVVDEPGGRRPAGVLHMHDLIEAGLA